MINKLILAVFSLLLSGLLILSIPLLNYAQYGGSKKKEQQKFSKVSIKKINLAKQLKKPRKKLKRPRRKRPSRTRLKSGPRFAMDLSVAGAAGVEVELDMLNKTRGQGVDKGDVDEKPFPNFPPPFRTPKVITDAAIPAYTAISFCVDETGHAFNIQTVEEDPPGMGMAKAGHDAIRKTIFQPAKKDGKAVPFCELEQPFEVTLYD
jgi:hypothetical protein